MFMVPVIPKVVITIDNADPQILTLPSSMLHQAPLPMLS